MAYSLRDWGGVSVHPSPTDIKVLTEKDDVDGQEVVPGFHCPVAEVFRNL